MATAEQVATLFLQDIHAPVTPGNIKAVEIWQSGETVTPDQNNNPWNLHSWGGLPGQIGYKNYGSGDQNVAIFSTIDQGVQANANNLLNLSKSNPQYGYGAVLAAFQQNNPAAALQAIGASSWAAGHYQYSYKDPKSGNTVSIPGTNTLLARFLGVGESTVFNGQQGSSGSGGNVVNASTSTQSWTGLLSDVLVNNTHGWTSWIDALSNSPFFGSVVGQKNMEGGTDYSSTNPASQAVINALKALGIDPNAPMSEADAAKLEQYLNNSGTSPGITGGGPPITQQLGLSGLFDSVQGALIFIGIILVGVVFVGTGGLIALRKNS